MPIDDGQLITIDVVDAGPVAGPVGTDSEHGDAGLDDDASWITRHGDRLGRGALIATILIVVVLLALGVALVVFGLLGGDTGPEPVATETEPTTTIERPPAISADVYEVIIPSIVYIEVSTGAAADGDAQIGVGTGVIVNGDGSILTAHHVVDGATSIRLLYADGTEAAGSIGDADPGNDIALLVADNPPSVIVPALLGSPDRMSVGDEAYVVGNPLGLAGSISAGVISGFNRSNIDPDAGIVLTGLIQFDAAVNPGNSGGPLLNRYGEVVGIVTSLASPSGDDRFSGIGFAVPIGAALGGPGVGPGQ